MASACVLHQPSVVVQVFQIYASVCASHGLQGSRRVVGYHGNSFQFCVKLRGRGSRVEQFPEAGNIERQKIQVEHGQRMTVIVKSKLIYELSVMFHNTHSIFADIIWAEIFKPDLSNSIPAPLYIFPRFCTFLMFRHSPDSFRPCSACFLSTLPPITSFNDSRSYCG